MSITKSAVDIGLNVLVALAFIGVTFLAIFGLIFVTSNGQIIRDAKNTGACDETCTVMNLERVERTDSCWCGDEDHTIRVSPYAWTNPDGTRAGRQIPDTVTARAEQ